MATHSGCQVKPPAKLNLSIEKKNIVESHVEKKGDEMN